jgi:hypothetical protein
MPHKADHRQHSTTNQQQLWGSCQMKHSCTVRKCDRLLVHHAGLRPSLPGTSALPCKQWRTIGLDIAPGHTANRAFRPSGFETCQGCIRGKQPLQEKMRHSECGACQQSTACTASVQQKAGNAQSDTKGKQEKRQTKPVREYHDMCQGHKECTKSGLARFDTGQCGKNCKTSAQAYVR